GWAAAGGLVLSAIQVATADPGLALLFPWRISVVLVPVATAAAAAGIGRAAERTVPGTGLALIASVLILAAVVGAGVVYANALGYQGSEAERELLSRVGRTRQPGDVYLLPVSYPKPPTARGTASTTFAPFVQTGRPAIFELQRFRLGTGAAAYVDFKSVPYRDFDVREWKRRVDAAVRWYATPDWDASGVAAEVSAAGITHVVVPATVAVRSLRLDPVHEDAAYRVYRLR
ncbi:MAG: DUF6798 domain-containing protein, partial [Fimbriiglobus sp.]